MRRVALTAICIFCIQGNENLENLEETEKMQSSKANAEGILPRVNPYSVITISPMQEKELLLSPEPTTQDGTISPTLSSGYSVPVPCGYAVPSNLPLILPAYSSPVIIRNPSVDEEGNVELCIIIFFKNRIIFLSMSSNFLDILNPLCNPKLCTLLSGLDIEFCTPPHSLNIFVNINKIYVVC